MKNTLMAVVLSFIATSASATFITGTVGFNGNVGIWDTDTAGYITNYANGERLDFANVTTSAVNPFLPSNTGTYSGLDGIATTMSSITYNPFYSVANPLWSFTSGTSTYSFELTSLNIVGPITDGFMSLAGRGTLMATGYQDTDGIWNWTAQTGLTFSAGSSVPEPSTLALLGLGLCGLGFARRKQAQA